MIDQIKKDAKEAFTLYFRPIVFLYNSVKTIALRVISGYK